MNCPFCKGEGKTDVDPEQLPHGLTCLNCNGTGDYDTMKLVRSCRLGEAHGRAEVQARAAGIEFTGRPLGFETIASAVIDDVRRQRHEEMLAPGSPERRRIEDRVSQLEREREPLLRVLARWGDEIRNELQTIT